MDQATSYYYVDDWLYGDGSDGDISLGTVALTDNQYGRQVTVTGTVTTAGLMIYATRSITVNVGGDVRAIGNNGGVTSGGSQAAFAWTGGSAGSGGNGAVGAGGTGGSTANQIGSRGGAGGAGVNAGGASGAAQVAPVTHGVTADLVVHLAIQIAMGGNSTGGLSVAQRFFGGTGGGGGGGNGTGTGGGGGAGGGVVLLYAPSITVEGSLTANGGNGGTPNAAGVGAQGGGGGGGGGAVITCSRQDAVAGSGTLTANAGTGAAGQGGGVTGSDGTNGYVKHIPLRGVF